MKMLKIFTVSLRIIQLALIVAFVAVTAFLIFSGQESTMDRYLTVSDPFLVPDNDSYNMLSDCGELQVAVNDKNFTEAQLIPIQIGLQLTSVETPALYFISINAIVLLSGTMLLIGIEQLIKMIQSAQSGQPFTRTNARRVYIIASLFLCYPLLQFIQRWSVATWMNKKIVLTGLEWSTKMEYDLTYFLTGVFLIALGKILERGVELQEEQQLTI